jgi:hypothetical protein
MVKKKRESPDTHEKLVFFDEFWFADRPSIFYGWARTNTRFRVPSYEKNRHIRYGFLTVDADTGHESLGFYQKLNSETVSDYFFQLTQDVAKEGYTQLTVILDNNSMHKTKMRAQLRQKMQACPELAQLSLSFIDTPRYSPDLNLAEYIIHYIRAKCLHHLPSRVNIQEVCENILKTVKKQHMQTKAQIDATIQRIIRLALHTSIK